MARVRKVETEVEKPKGIKTKKSKSSSDVVIIDTAGRLHNKVNLMAVHGHF